MHMPGGGGPMQVILRTEHPLTNDVASGLTHELPGFMVLVIRPAAQSWHPVRVRVRFKVKRILASTRRELRLNLRA